MDETIKLIVIDAPLLFEAKLDKFCDTTIAIETTQDVKIKRICERDKISEKVAKDRLKIQKSNKFYTQNADYVIQNGENTSLETLHQKVNVILENLAIVGKIC